MNTTINHELIKMPDWNFPVKVMRRETNRESIGCTFHWHEQIEFYLVKRGRLLLLCNGEQDWIYEGDIAVVNCCYPHKSINFVDGTLHYCIQIDLSILSSGIGDICNKFTQELTQNRLTFTRFIRQDAQIAMLLSQIVDEYENMNKGYELAIKACLYNIFTRLYRVYAEEDLSCKFIGSHRKELHLITRLLLYIAENFTSKLSLSCLAESIGVSVPHMCRIFKKSTGITIVEYINQLRCYRARFLLTNGNNVTGAAFAVGYTDSNYFSRVFKQIFGVSPSSFLYAGDASQHLPL